MTKRLLFFFFLTVNVASQAQQLEVLGFHSNPTSIEACKFPKNDLNGERCGLVKLGLVIPEAIFEGNVVYKEYKSGEWWIYLTKGSRWLTIKSKEYLPLQYEFPEPIQSNVTYVMTVEKKGNHIASEEVLFKKCQSPNAVLNDFIAYLFYYGEPNNKIDNHYNEVLAKFMDNSKTRSSNSSDNTIVDENDSKIDKKREEAIRAWLEAAKKELDKEQEKGLEPLNRDGTKWELDKGEAEKKLNRIKKDLEEYKKLCGEECKDQAPKFGLG